MIAARRTNCREQAFTRFDRWSLSAMEISRQQRITHVQNHWQQCISFGNLAFRSQLLRLTLLTQTRLLVTRPKEARRALAGLNDLPFLLVGVVCLIFVSHSKPHVSAPAGLSFTHHGRILE